ncbi:Endonuclease-reverse transcriptase HmRTE-e01 [Operophtera brumata]|uniref:Endonuclease-reverse transcriptase HmRTE-e01 n=1 Tax=Operophtera brumata TaxID=104452 RepID=A0A0L7KRV7_OPEBR|nr:Endonuclease-reverse transcriptase HmRTE-e01 [Operophtera brumata]
MYLPGKRATIQVFEFYIIGAINNNKDTSWWNEEVREKLETKKTLFKLWQQTKDDDDHQAYKIAKKIAKRAVAQAKATARDDFYAQLETASNDREIFKLAKRKHQSSRDTATNKFIKNDQGKLLTSNEDIRDRWKEYYTELLNEGNFKYFRQCGEKLRDERADFG